MAEHIDKLAQVEETNLLQVLPLLISGGSTERHEMSLSEPISLRRPQHRIMFDKTLCTEYSGKNYPGKNIWRAVYKAFES